MTVRKQTPNVNKKITQIHKYCVHEAFSKMGPIYVSFVPEEPAQHPSIAESISILTDKINHTNNDVDRDLFQAMRHILTYKDSESENHRFFFGTDRFEYVWQDKAQRVSYRHVCRYCGTEYINNRAVASYCSRACFAKARTREDADG